MMRPKLTPISPLWETYIRFRLGQLSREDRTRAKTLLHGINYGLYDIEDAEAEIEKRRGTMKMSKANGGARLSYIRVAITVHRVTAKAVLANQGAEGDSESKWLPMIALSHRSEQLIEGIHSFPVELTDVEIVQWKADELGWRA